MTRAYQPASGTVWLTLSWAMRRDEVSLGCLWEVTFIFLLPSDVKRNTSLFFCRLSCSLQRKTRKDFEQIAFFFSSFVVPYVHFFPTSWSKMQLWFLDGVTAAGARQAVPSPSGSLCPLLFISLALIHPEITGLVFFYPAFSPFSRRSLCSTASSCVGLSPLGEMDKLSPKLLGVEKSTP